MEGNIIEMISQSFREVNRVGSLISFFLGFLISGLFFVWLRSLLKSHRKTVIEIPIAKKIHSPLVVKPKIEPAQYEAIQDIITDFKKIEKTAQAVPAYILERYSEFFLHSMKRLQLNRKNQQEIQNTYPLLVGYHAECEIFKNEKLFLFETEVRERTPEGIVLQYAPNLQFVIEKGDEIIVAYTVDRFHFRGKTRVVQLRSDDMFVIAPLKKIYLSAERRYERLPIGVVSLLRDIRQKDPVQVLLMDLSWEGCRIRGPKLDKKTVYYLTIPLENGNVQLECVISREILRTENDWVYSLAFLYLPYEVREKLMHFLKEKALEIKLATMHPVPGITEKKPQ
ncbi:PilZ domain-containing protein [Thermospira aquatica]|uniref:PilZ domain-containing protein n=1 Tax=Thermospira aquatica TaxID=2828656 RepID=A0AAX3BFR6_9SPIR|nr:hypothetical protein [Thermospira aquatica]URA11145.1 hypothetical protein KDW03_04945 [Thermospira aquatica]